MRLLRESNNSILKKIRSRVGESIAETLVALLIGALALTMLAGAVSAAGNIVTKSRTTLDRYYTTNETTVVGMTGESTGAIITMKASTSSSGSSGSGGTSGSTSGGTSGTSGSGIEGLKLNINEENNIICYKNETFGKTPVIAYKKQ